MVDALSKARPTYARHHTFFPPIYVVDTSVDTSRGVKQKNVVDYYFLAISLQMLSRYGCTLG